MCFTSFFTPLRDKSIASRLSLPDTNYLLDYVRPDYLLLRVVARSLILWHEVEPTTEWVDDQVPSVLKSSYDNLQKTAVGLSSIPNDKNVDQFMEEDKIEGDLNMMIAFSDDTQVDRQAVRQSYAFIIAGGCFSLGLRYAGTGNKTASSTIMKYVRDFYRLRKENDPISAVLRPEKQILEICCACSALSLAMVMAGTGDMETFQLLRELRWLCDEEIRYGIFMTYAAAIGLLFLGGGSCTLGNEPSDIASLVLAFFPCFPTSTCDNQYHLQALRHVYALSVRQRSIETIDIDSNQPVFLPVEVSIIPGLLDHYFPPLFLLILILRNVFSI
jgi:anaphase-promoting complex subunit 1